MATPTLATEKQKVVVAIDESDCSHYALQWALDQLFDTMTKSDVILFTVQPVADYGYVYASSMGAARKASLSSSSAS